MGRITIFKTMKQLFLIFLCLLSGSAFGQYFAGEEISKSGLTPWLAKESNEYEGGYHFGYSEDECELRIIIWDTMVIAQTSCWTIDTLTNAFKDTFANFTNVKIIGNSFFSDQTNGEFVTYENDRGSSVGLLVYKSWTYVFNQGGEFGSRYPDEEIHLPGNYAFASTKLLKEKDLEKYSLYQLKIIRNEIFARYGMAFQKGGEMDTYFSKQTWYKRNYSKVDQWLTQIEIINLETIKVVEKKKSETK